MYSGLPSSCQWSRPNSQVDHVRTSRISMSPLRKNENHDTSNNVNSNSSVRNVRRTYSTSGAIALSTDSSAETILRLSVGGSGFSLRSATIRSRATGFLSWFCSIDHKSRLQQCDGYLQATNEYFFERSPSLFDPIYQFYVTGMLHRPGASCLEEFIDELNFWDIPDTAIAQCCSFKSDNESIAGDSNDGSELGTNVNEFSDLKYGTERRVVWDVIENPASSRCAKIFAACSISFVLLSITGLVLGSIPELQVPAPDPNAKIDSNSTEIKEKDVHPVLVQVEYVCIVWFTIEYLLKMAVAADRWKTFTVALNLVDLMAIVPFYIELALAVVGFNTEQLRDLKGAFLVIRILRVLRVVRIFKLGRYSSGLQTFAKTLKASLKQLGMMAMVMMTGVIFFSTLVYFLEKDEPDTQFYSIPAAFWWCIVSFAST